MHVLQVPAGEVYAAPYVDLSESGQATLDAARHLLELGHRRIGMIAPPVGLHVARERVRTVRVPGDERLADVAGAAARQRDVHAMVGGIDAANTASIALHERLGFRHVGTLPQVGFKFGRWLDAAFYQLNLATPVQPVDG